MSEAIEIWHNTRCSKSRDAFRYLTDKNLEVNWVDYMKKPIERSELLSVLHKLGITAFDLIRKKEAIYMEQFKGLEKTNEEWIEILIENPKLIERPIVIRAEKAVIARPLEKIEQLFST